MRCYFQKNFNHNQKTWIAILLSVITVLSMHQLHMLVLVAQVKSVHPDYWEWADFILKNGTLFGFQDIYHSYLYPLYQSSLKLLSGERIWVTVLLQMSIYLAALSYWINKVHNRISWVQIILICTCPYIWYFGSSLSHSEIFAISLYVLSLSLLQQVKDKSINTQPSLILISGFIWCVVLIIVTQPRFFLFGTTFLVFSLYRILKGYKKKILAFFIFIILLIAVWFPNYINSKNYRVEDGGSVSSPQLFGWSLYSGALEFQNFPESTVIDNSVSIKYPDRYFSKDINFYSLWLNEMLEQPLPVFRNYLYKTYRVWVPMSNKGIGSSGEILSRLYGSIIFIFFIAGICVLIKQRKIRNYYYLLIPVCVLWAQQIFLHTESRYMLMGRLTECFIASYGIMACYQTILCKFSFRKR